MPDNLGSGAATQERFGGQYRKTRREAAVMIESPAEAERTGRNGVTATLDPNGERPALSSLEPNGLTEPVYPPAGWTDRADHAIASIAIADHPLLRGLLLELPPKGAVPAPGWLDRWFEAARSILELLYLQDANRPR